MSASAPASAAAEPKSDPPAKGRFTLGNKGGPGNPFARQVAEYRKRLLNAVPGEELDEIIRAIVEKAKTGDVAAAKLILLYIVGKPAEAVEPDRIELEDHRLRTESMVPMSAWGPAFGLLPVRSANKLWEGAAEEMEEETLLPMALGTLEVDLAPPEDKAKVQRQTNRMIRRILEDGIPPSPNGAIGRKLEKLRQAIHGEPKPPAKRTKSARTG